MTGLELHEALVIATGDPGGRGSKLRISKQLGITYGRYVTETTRSGGDPAVATILDFARRAGIRVVVDPLGEVTHEIRIQAPPAPKPSTSKA